MEIKIMRLAGKKWKGANQEVEIRKKDQRYHEVTILRELARYSEQFGEGALKEFFKEITEEAQE